MRLANEVTRRSVVDLDGFSDFTSEVEGEEDVNLSSMIIKGMKIKYIMPHWLDSAENNITGTCLTAVGLLRVVNK